MFAAIAVGRHKNTALAHHHGARSNAVAKDGALTEGQIAGSLSLGRRQPLAIVAQCGLMVRVRSGSLWITQHKDRADRIIGAGERFVADRAGTLVISALRTAELSIEWPSPEFGRPSPRLAPAAVAA
ncbi:MAG: DUF2917 domain-containing protein [Burkholderiales bacterium]